MLRPDLLKTCIQSEAIWYYYVLNCSPNKLFAGIKTANRTYQIFVQNKQKTRLNDHDFTSSVIAESSTA